MLIKLKNGHDMPMIGLGTYLCSTKQAEDCVTYALKIGYRSIDTAEYYNNHEGIAQAIANNPDINRSDIFIIDKLNPTKNMVTFEPKSYDDVVASVHHHLKRLNIEYIDLYLIHSPFGKANRVEQYRALVDLQTQGFIHEIGVSNYNIHHLEEIIAAGLPLPAVNQIEIHPLCLQAPLVAYLHQHGIVPQAYSSLVPLDSWRSDPNQESSKTQEDIDRMRKNSEQLSAIAAHHHISDAQVLLKWALQHGYPIIPKSINEGRIKSNFDLMRFELDESEMKVLDSFDEGKPYAWSIGNPLLVE